MEFFDTIRQVKSNWQPFKKWDIEQQKKEKQNDEINKKYPPKPQELENAKQYGRTIVDVINTMDQYSIDKSEDAALMISTYAQFFDMSIWAFLAPVNALIKKIPFLKKQKNNLCSLLIALFLETEIARVAMNIIKAKYEKQASRIARYQTRENELKDSRNFVVYNQAQIDEAKKIAKNLPEPKDNVKQRIKGFHPFKDYESAQKTVNKLAKDFGQYKNWKNEYAKERKAKIESFKTLNPSKEELNKAGNDRDAILGTIKKIENFSLDYLNNISMAIGFLVSGISLAGFGLGHCLNLIISKSLSKVKISGKDLKKLSQIKMANYVLFPAFLPMILLSSVIKMQKDAARVGRFKAKQDLLAHPNNFVSHNAEQRKSINLDKNNDIKTKSFMQKICKDFEEIKNYKKDYNDYQKYMKTEHKEELKLDNALKQVKISDTQSKNSVKMQKDAFHSFEAMDEKAQRFTDDTNAAVNIICSSFTSLMTCSFRIWTVIRGNDLLSTPEKINDKNIGKALIPFILPSLISPFIKMIGTRFKKDAGKIGVMNAMQDLNDPKNFLDNNSYQQKL